MHEAYKQLAREVSVLQESLRALTRKLEAQSEREIQALDRVAYGRRFDAEQAPIQERVVAAVGEGLEALDAACRELEEARLILQDMPTR